MCKIVSMAEDGKDKPKPGPKRKKPRKKVRPRLLAKDQDVTRDVMFTYRPGFVDEKLSPQAVETFYWYEPDQLVFLDEYARTFDLDVARKAAGVSPSTVSEWLGQENFKAEFQEIYDIYKANRKMKAEYAGARLLRLMDKMEGDYDGADDIGDRAKMATPLVKAADSYLKATGMYGGGTGGSTGIDVNITIDLGGEGYDEIEQAEVIENGELD